MTETGNQLPDNNSSQEIERGQNLTLFNQPGTLFFISLSAIRGYNHILASSLSEFLFCQPGRKHPAERFFCGAVSLGTPDYNLHFRVNSLFHYLRKLRPCKTENQVKHATTLCNIIHYTSRVSSHYNIADTTPGTTQLTTGPYYLPCFARRGNLVLKFLRVSLGKLATHIILEQQEEFEG